MKTNSSGTGKTRVRSENCKRYQLLNILGKKRVIFILYALSEGCNSLNSIHKTIPMMSAKVLSDRLQSLQKNCIVEKKIFSTTPLKIKYTLTEFGINIAKKIVELGDA